MLLISKRITASRTKPTICLLDQPSIRSGVNYSMKDNFDEKFLKCSHRCESWFVDKILEFAGTSFFQSECTCKV